MAESFWVSFGVGIVVVVVVAIFAAVKWQRTGLGNLERRHHSYNGGDLIYRLRRDASPNELWRPENVDRRRRLKISARTNVLNWAQGIRRCLEIAVRILNTAVLSCGKTGVHHVLACRA